jgi:hypothetical protein
MTHCLVNHHITGAWCLCFSVQSEFWCVLRLIIPPAAKFALLSTFLALKNMMNAAEIHLKLCAAVYGQIAMSEGTVRQWCRMFKDGQWTNVHDEERNGQPPAWSDDLVQSERRRFTISELLCEFPQISRTVLYEIITVRLGCHKFCTRCFPKMLTCANKI